MPEKFYETVPVVDLTKLYSDNEKLKIRMRTVRTGLGLIFVLGTAFAVHVVRKFNKLEKKPDTDETVG